MLIWSKPYLPSLFILFTKRKGIEYNNCFYLLPEKKSLRKSGGKNLLKKISNWPNGK